MTTADVCKGPKSILSEGWAPFHGRRVRFLVGGNGPPLVLCHGFLGSAENFESWFADLAPHRRLVIPDLPGSGATPPLAGQHTAETLAEAVLAVVDHLHIRKFDLGGLCLGAAVALAAMTNRPDSVDRLILHTPLLATSVVRRRFHAQAAVLTAPAVFPTIVWMAHQRLVSDLYKRMLVEGDDVDPSAAQMNFDNQRRADPRAAREWLRDGLRRNDVRKVQERRRPTLLLVAADDRLVDVARVRDVAATSASVVAAVIEEAGHGWNESFVRRQLAVITDFLQSATS